MSHHNAGLGAIAQNVHTVLRSFRTLDDALDGQDQALIHSFEDEKTRFKMWAGNLGAHQRGRASLDYRLREAPHLQEQVVYLLKDLSQSLQDALSMACDDAKETQAKALDDGQRGEDSFTDSDFTDSDDEQGPPQSGLAGVSVDIQEAIDCLLRLSVAIANPAPHERVRVRGAGPLEDVSFRETYDIGYVRDKFPRMDFRLAQVLGRAITRRRQFFKYREAHHARLAAGLETLVHDGNVGAEDTARTEIVPKTVASSLPEHLKSLTNVDLTTGVLDEDNTSETGLSQTSYATSAGFLAGDVDGQPMKPPPPLKVPPLPKGADRGSFECPFCYRMVSASTRAAWK
jgi:hypothetical protein